MTYPFGVDISFYQKDVDFHEMMNADLPPTFIGIRAGQGTYAIDPYFASNWEQAKNKGLHRSAYHVTEFFGKGKLQAELLFDRATVYGFDPDHDKLCLDVELNRDYSRNTITEVTLEAINRLKTLTGVYPLIYSRASWINAYLNLNSLPETDWWLAGYKKRLPAPLFTPELDPQYLAIPKGVKRERVKIHQTGEHGNGHKYGVQSWYIDTDRFLGTLEEMWAWFGYVETQPEPEPEPEPENPIYKVKVASWAEPSVNLRNEPRIAQETDIGDAAPDKELTILEERVVNGDKWLRSTEGWIMARYIEKLFDETPLYRVQVTSWATPYVNLRSEPRVAENTDIGDMLPNDFATVFEEREVAGEKWLRTDGGWLKAFFTQRVDGEDEPGTIEGLLVVPYYSQNDPRWKNDLLGYSQTTMGNFGCLVTALAAYMTYLGQNVNPGNLNKLYKARGGFTGNRIYWQMPKTIWGIEKPEDFSFASGTGFEEKLDAILADNRPALAMVDYIPGGKFDQHWVLILGKINGVYFLLDPWDGTVQALHARYHKIFRIVGYK